MLKNTFPQQETNGCGYGTNGQWLWPWTFQVCMSVYIMSIAELAGCMWSCVNMKQKGGIAERKGEVDRLHQGKTVNEFRKD